MKYDFVCKRVQRYCLHQKAPTDRDLTEVRPDDGTQQRQGRRACGVPRAFIGQVCCVQLGAHLLALLPLKQVHRRRLRQQLLLPRHALLHVRRRRLLRRIQHLSLFRLFTSVCSPPSRCNEQK